MTFKLNSKLFGSLVRAELYDSEVKVQDQYLSSKTQTDREEILKYGVKFDPFSETQQNSASDWCASLKERVINLFQDDNDFYKIQLISDNIFPTSVEDNNSTENIDFFQSVIYDSNEYTIIDLSEGIDKVCLFDKNTEYPYGNITVEFNSIEKQCEKILIITLSPNPLNEIINISSQIYKNQEDPHRNKNDYFVRNSQLTKDFYRVNNKQTLEDRENQIGIGQGDPESYSYQIGNLAIDPISHVILGTEKRNSLPILFQKFYNKRKINSQFQWDKNTEYSLGDQVFCCGQIWISTIDGNLGLHPQLSPFWKIFSEESQEINLSRRDLPELENEGEEEPEGDEDQSQENSLPSYFKLYHSSNIETDIDEAEVFGGVGYFKYRGTSNMGRFVLSDNEIQISTSRNLNEGYIEATVSNLQPGKYYTITIYEN